MAYSYNLEEKFGVKLDGVECIDLSTSTVGDVEKYFKESKGFCKHCDFKRIQYVKWEQTSKDIHEWIK